MKINLIQNYKFNTLSFSGNNDKNVQKKDNLPENLFKSRDPFVLSEELLKEYKKIPQEVIDNPSRAKEGTMKPHELINGFTENFIDNHMVYRGLCTPKLVSGAKTVLKVAMICEKEDKELARCLYDNLWCKIPHSYYSDNEDQDEKDAKAIKEFAGQKALNLGYSLYGPKIDKELINYLMEDLMEELSNKKQISGDDNNIFLKKDVDYKVTDEE